MYDRTRSTIDRLILFSCSWPASVIDPCFVVSAVQRQSSLSFDFFFLFFFRLLCSDSSSFICFYRNWHYSLEGNIRFKKENALVAKGYCRSIPVFVVSYEMSISRREWVTDGSGPVGFVNRRQSSYSSYSSISPFFPPIFGTDRYITLLRRLLGAAVQIFAIEFALMDQIIAPVII